MRPAQNNATTSATTGGILLSVYSVSEYDVHFAYTREGVKRGAVSRDPSDASAIRGSMLSPVAFDAGAEKCHNGCRIGAA